jgi:SAM-dependent methyltransferase
MTFACSHPADSRERLFTARDYITGDPFEICRCRACGFVVTWPQPDAAGMARYYPAGYFGGGQERRFPAVAEAFQQMLYSARARLVERMNGCRTGRVLDIGCGPGLLLREFQRHGWEVQGTELNEASAAYARDKLEIPVHTGPATELPWPTNHFDAVVMWHVLEHLPDARQALREVARVLRPGGVFLIGVPNFGSTEARMAQDKWFHLDVPRHLTHFTRESLTAALAETGFTIKRLSFFAPEYDCFSFTQSALNGLGLRQNLLYNLLRAGSAKLWRDQGSSWGRIMIYLLLAAPLAMLSVPATLLAGFLGTGATMTIVATNKQ